MSAAGDIVDLGTAVVAALNAAAADIGIRAAELRFEGQGVDVVAPGVIVMLAPPSSPDGVALPAFQQWECTLFICASGAATVAQAAIAAMTIAQKAHALLRPAFRGQLELNAAEPFAIVRALPTNFICAVNYDVPFSLFP